MKHLCYKNKPIGSLDSLARALNVSVDKLLEVAESTEVSYIPNEPIIKHGKTRQTYAVNEPLHSIQDNILEKIISGVEFPDFLQGSIRDLNFPRDYVRDANIHARSEVLLKEDISRFFSSTRATLVYRTWKYFFNFPDEVAEILTNLTTYKDFLPEGASTSPAISNLVFWDREPNLEFDLRQKGYVYSRYVDDISVSFATRIDKDELQNITTKIYRMFIACGLKPNRDKDENGILKKRVVRTKNKPMTLHGLNINSGKATLPKSERSKIRAAVKELETSALSATSWDEIKKTYEKVNGRVNLMKRLHPNEAQKYIIRMKNIKKQMISSKEDK
jgi:Reverse transcriptase (RNA-dependent DNA polymerase)